MISKELINYLKQATARGLTEDQIRKDLITFGWSIDDVEKHFQELRKGVPSLSPKRRDVLSNLEKTVQKFQGSPEVVKPHKQSYFLTIVIAIAAAILIIGLLLSFQIIP